MDRHNEITFSVTVRIKKEIPKPFTITPEELAEQTHKFLTEKTDEFLGSGGHVVLVGREDSKA